MEYIYIYIKHGQLRTNKGILQCRHIKQWHYCDIVRDHCQQVTKPKHVTRSHISRRKLSDI